VEKTQVRSKRQPVNRYSTATIEIPYEDDLLHHLEDDGTIIHDPLYPDPYCPCHEEDEQGDTSSDFAFALVSYQHDFFSIALVGNNTGGVCFERQIMDRVLRGAA